MQDYNKKKIAVIGLGGVGGYIAALLGNAYSDVTFVARGPRKKEIEENGLVLHSDYKGEFRTVPAHVTTVEDLEPQDYIFVCVKNYSLKDVCLAMKHAVKEDTVIIPVMNGVDPGDNSRKYVGKGTVVDSLIYIVAFSNPDYSITQQGNFASLRIGITNATKAEQQKVREVSEILSGEGAQIDHKVSDKIEGEIWKKYILNCAFNVETAVYNQTIGELRTDAEKSKEYEALIQEAWMVAKKKNIAITQDDIDAIIHRFYHEYADNATSSLQRDVVSGKISECETFSGYIVREGRKAGLSLPISEKMYLELKKKKADVYHHMVYNCAQAVLCTFCEELDLDENVAFRISEGFGLGMGIMEMCGALSGMAMAIGMKNSVGDLSKGTVTKGDTYRKIKENILAFQEKNGSYLCRELKGVETGKVLLSCPMCISEAVELTNQYLKQFVK